MVVVTEIAPDLFRLSIHVPDFDLQFNHFLVRDEEPLLFHAGLKGMFPALRDAVATLIDPTQLRHIAWSHFESDEIGGLNHWLELAPQAQPVCTLVGKLVSVDDFALRPARGMAEGDVLSTGQYRFRFHRTPHLPHGWDAGLLFEETRRTLFCSDLFHQFGDVAAVTYLRSDRAGTPGDAADAERPPGRLHALHQPVGRPACGGWPRCSRRRWPSCTAPRSPAAASRC